ncbi:hypothetical protein NDI37_05385 [Funiculus sociatus GB2-A5]|uniref:Uncharacterized protein n=1 Tax=Funiculus sociatus GB2-A5 TaxID=2933946 RepID=A0ABV0JKD2_9CYAN|nr:MULTISPECIES: hypothetical protein [unclassified Trichocoleus]MBD1905153.1 hypothetical protein [Trichocoleus sp. FACHB-832]MBD2060982.1 hypothetical protein [Trichocoleus sp. FACHB-6]
MSSIPVFPSWSLAISLYHPRATSALLKRAQVVKNAIAHHQRQKFALPESKYGFV